MGDSDELTSAGRKGLAAKMCNTVFCDDVVNIVFAGGDDSSGFKDGLDAADGSVLCGGCESNKALAALGLGCAADIVDLAACTGHVLCANALCANLTPNVALESGIYGDHISVLADNVRIIDVVNGKESDAGVIVYKVIELSGAVGKSGNGLAAVNLLLTVVGSAALQQFNHGVCKHFGMDTKVVLAFKCAADSIGDSADTQLNAGAIFNKLGDECTTNTRTA